jgi:hypothetical protein
VRSSVLHNCLRNHLSMRALLLLALCAAACAEAPESA